MRQFSLASVLGVALIVLSGCTAQPKWQTVTAKEEGFSVEFPGESERSSNGDMTTYKCDLPDGTSYSVTVIQRAKTDPITDKAIDERLDEMLNMTPELQMTRVSKQKITLGKVRGIETLDQYPENSATFGNGASRRRIYHTGPKEYWVAVTSMRDFRPVRTPEADRFFASFKIESKN
jgi:hypothetical protein